MPHQILHDTRNSAEQRRKLANLLFSADDRTVFEGQRTGRNYHKNCKHSIWAKVTIEEAESLVRGTGI